MGNPWAGLRDRVLASSAGRQIRGSGLKARLIRGASGTYAVRTGNAGLRFLTSLVLARLLGADGFGVYNFAMAWLLFLIVPALFGVDRLLVRDLAVYHGRAAWGLMRGLLRYTTRMTLVVSLLLVAASAAIAWLTYQLTGRPALLDAHQSDVALAALYTLLIALVLLPLRAILLVQQAALQGLKKIVEGQYPEQVVQPALFLLLIGGAYMAGSAIDSVQWAMALQVVTTIVALSYSTILLRRTIPPDVYRAPVVFHTQAWAASAIPLALSRGLSTANQQIDQLMLGAMVGAKSVGLFTVVQGSTQLVSLLLISVNIALAPTIAQLHAEGRRRELQRAMTQSARLVLLAAIPPTILFIVCGNAFLGLFGKEYTPAYTALVLMSLGQLVNAASGSVALLLMMTGYERDAMWGIGISVVVHLVLNLLLLPFYGLNGSAFASAASMALWNLILIAMVWHRLKIHTTAFGALWRGGA